MQVCTLKARLGGEPSHSDVKMHKGYCAFKWHYSSPMHKLIYMTYISCMLMLDCGHCGLVIDENFCDFFYVIELAEIDGLTPELAVTFFIKKVFPSVKEYQVELENFVTDDAPSDEPLIVQVLTKCVSSYKIPVQQVR